MTAVLAFLTAVLAYHLSAQHTQLAAPAQNTCTATFLHSEISCMLPHAHGAEMLGGAANSRDRAVGKACLYVCLVSRPLPAASSTVRGTVRMRATDLHDAWPSLEASHTVCITAESLSCAQCAACPAKIRVVVSVWCTDAL